MGQSLSCLKNIEDSQPGTSKSVNINIQEENCNKKRSSLPAHQPRDQQKDSKCTSRGIIGELYELKLIILFLLRGLTFGYTFKLGSEVKQARKFNDIVFQYDNVNGKKQYRLFQVKHTFDESRKIANDSLFTEEDSNFSLVKYFFSYKDLRQEKLFKNASIKDVTLCTNITFEDYTNVNEIEDKDDILDVKHKTKQPKRYTFSKNIIPLLRPMLHNYNLTRLARRLAECFLENKPIKHHDKTDIFATFHLALAEEVLSIDPIRNRKNHLFREAFIKGENLSDTAEKFRSLFIEELNKKSDGHLKLKDVNKAITNKQKINDNTTHVALNLSSNFGKRQNDNSISENPPQLWPDNSIPDGDIEDFLNHLVFAVGLPNEDELGNLLKDELDKLVHFDSITQEDVYNKIFTSTLDWFKAKPEAHFLSHTDARDIVENAIIRPPIWFGIRHPTDFFTGQCNKLDNIHKTLQTGHITAILQTVSIGGLGGIDKSELARKYAYQHSGDYDNKIIWINAESYQTLLKSFQSLAQEKLGINIKNSDGKDKSITTILEDVYRFFSRGKSLFIFDNAEKLRSEKDFDEGIDKFLPSSAYNMNKPSVLITSRNKEWGRTTKIISLDVLTKNEAIELVKKSLDITDDSESKEIKKLVTLLQCFPLALQQAIAYIRQTNSKLQYMGLTFLIKDYIKKFENEKKKLLTFEFPSDSNDLYTRTTYTTWKITIDRILDNQECGLEAELLLNMMAFCDHPDQMTSEDFSLIVGKDKMTSAIHLLKQYSMIQSSHKQGMLSVHRLVQLVVRINLEKTMKYHNGHPVSTLSKKFPDSRIIHFVTLGTRLKRIFKGI